MRVLRRASVLLRKTREVGPLYASQLIFVWLIPSFVFDINQLVVISGDLGFLREYRTDDPEFRWAGPDEIDKMAATGVAVATAQKRFEQGARLAVVDRGGRFVAYYWCQMDGVDQYDWLRFKLSPNDAWNTYAWVAPELRGHGVHARIRSFAYGELARAGYTRGMSVIDALNRNSISAAAKSSALPISSIWYVRCLGFTLVRFDRSIRVGWWGLGRRLELPVGELGGNEGSQARE